MADLEPEMKLFIAQQLGAYARPATLIKTIFESFGVTVTKQQLQAYDPDTVAGKKLSADLAAAFRKARREADDAGQNLAITHRGYRLRRLQDLLDDDQRGLSPKVVVEVITLYEKTEGGMFRQRETGATDEQVEAHVTEMATKLKRAVAASVTNPQEVERAFKAIDQELEAESEPGSA